MAESIKENHLQQIIQQNINALKSNELITLLFVSTDKKKSPQSNF